jgi:hypothetical protein
MAADEATSLGAPDQAGAQSANPGSGKIEPLQAFRNGLLVVVATASFVGLLLVFAKSLDLILSHRANPAWDPMQIMELYFAGAGAFLVVTVFRTVEGPMRFGATGFGFQGYSGPIIMWVFVFLALCLGMKTIGFPHQIGVAPAVIHLPAAAPKP